MSIRHPQKVKMICYLNCLLLSCAFVTLLEVDNDLNAHVLNIPELPQIPSPFTTRVDTSNGKVLNLIFIRNQVIRKSIISFNLFTVSSMSPDSKPV